ncbi:DUF6891 domain-containing protein [Propionicicella superfundia]|uniref:DUF6891 domain-containing protein n=1 Tax=Propionicicella superfundia TaxID=348582 RepID=UPI0004104D7E|nr:hypothetical protein [Propionicicella superfundia]
MTTPTNDQPAGLRLPASLGLTPDVEQDLRDAAWRHILRGDPDPDGFLELYEEEFRDWHVSEESGRAAFAAVLDARRQQQSAWPDVRSALTAAFSELGSLGVVARENFSCCGNCGTDEIWGERDGAGTARGYVFYHMQDADRLIEDRQTYVNYGVFLDAWMPEDEWNALTDAQQGETYERLTTALMVDEVFPVLERHGVEVIWNRDLGTRILLGDVDYYAEV